MFACAIISVVEFNSARGHRIERENYLNELKRYEREPLNFDSHSYNIPQYEKRGQKRSMRKQIKPLMEVPPPLIPPYRIHSKPARISRAKDRIQPLMQLPPPLIPPEFLFMNDPRPHLDFNNRTTSGRPSQVSSRHSESRGLQQVYRNKNSRRP